MEEENRKEKALNKRELFGCVWVVSIFKPCDVYYILLPPNGTPFTHDSHIVVRVWIERESLKEENRKKTRKKYLKHFGDEFVTFLLNPFAFSFIIDVRTLTKTYAHPKLW